MSVASYVACFVIVAFVSWVFPLTILYIQKRNQYIVWLFYSKSCFCWFVTPIIARPLYWFPPILFVFFTGSRHYPLFIFFTGFCHLSLPDFFPGSRHSSLLVSFTGTHSPPPPHPHPPPRQSPLEFFTGIWCVFFVGFFAVNECVKKTRYTWQRYGL